MRWIVSSSALQALVVLLALAAATAPWVARRSVPSRRSSVWFLALASLAPVLALTLFRGDVAFAFEPARLLQWSGRGLDALSRDPLGSDQFLLNVALFVPAGLAWTWLVREPLRVWAGLATLALAVEAIQALTGSGANDVVDLVANALGAGLGTLLAHVILRAAVPGSADPASEPVGPRRSPRAPILGTLVALVALLAAWYGGAERRQTRLVDELTVRFSETTRAEVQAALGADPETIFGAISQRADGMVSSSERVVLRFPATYFSLQRCVFVVWEGQTPPDIVRASGDDCTQFLG